MNKLILTAIFLSFFSMVYSQQNILILKKRNRTIANFWKGSIIAFQLKDKSWRKGEIRKITKDSIYIKPTIVQYNFMSVDTMYASVEGYPLTELFSFPKSGVHVDYVDGRFQMFISGSHVQGYWLKSGWIFRVGAIGYAALKIINGVIKNSFSWSDDKTQLGIGAAVLIGGVILDKTYKPTFRLGKKYHIDFLDLSNKKQ